MMIKIKEYNTLSIIVIENVEKFENYKKFVIENKRFPA